ncbi:chaperone modulator CbpM [Phaeovulum sp.]|uniref:chaperone modulator CbpM n=1 Tax=Phaeovulum sp. TaxID=2934796 RepID=UPI00356259B4
MTDRLTEDDVIAAIPGLTRARLIGFIEAEVVIPIRAETGPVFRQIDLARMELLCDLLDDLDLDESALAVVMSLIDQLHTARQDLRALARALQSEPPEVRARIGAALRGAD